MKKSRSLTTIAAATVAALLLLVLVPIGSPPRHARAQNPGVCGPMDVAFVIDDTGSMGGAISNVQTELASILGNIATASGNDYRLALVDFPNDNVHVYDNFAANNQATVGPHILGLVASGGAGEPESSDESLNTVVNALPAAGRPQNVDFTPAYRAGALKIAILVTDARPGGFDDTYTPGVDDVHAHLVALAAAARGVKISAVLVGGRFDTPTIIPIMQDYATTSGGVYTLAAPDGTGTGAAIEKIIAACGSGAGPDLTVTKELKPGIPKPVAGGLTSFLIRVKNVGGQPTPPPPTDVMLRDDLSGVGTFVSWIANSGRCTGAAGNPYVDCVRGRMAPGEEWVVEITVRLPKAVNGCTGLVNRAIVDRYNLIKETNETNNTAELTILAPASDRCIDTDGTVTSGDGFANPVTPGSVQVFVGAPLHSWPTGLDAEGLDMFDNDHNGAWTFGSAGDDLHVESPDRHPGAIRNGIHDHPQDPHVLDYDGSLNVTGQAVNCDFEVGAFCPSTLPGNVKFYDANGNGFWDDGEDIVLDANNNNIFD